MFQEPLDHEVLVELNILHYVFSQVRIAVNLQAKFFRIKVYLKILNTYLQLPLVVWIHLYLPVERQVINRDLNDSSIDHHRWSTHHPVPQLHIYVNIILRDLYCVSLLIKPDF